MECTRQRRQLPSAPQKHTNTRTPDKQCMQMHALRRRYKGYFTRDALGSHVQVNAIILIVCAVIDRKGGGLTVPCNREYMRELDKVCGVRASATPAHVFKSRKYILRFAFITFADLPQYRNGKHQHSGRCRLHGTNARVCT